MNRKMRALRRLRWLREQQRNQAAAHAHQAQRSVRHADFELAEQQERHGAAAQAMTTQIISLIRVSDVELLRMDLTDFERGIRASQHVASQARLVAQASGAQLGAKERALRTTEKLIEKAAQEAHKKQERQEQRENDDRANARRKKVV